MKKNKSFVRLALVGAFLICSESLVFGQLASPKFLTIHKADNANDVYGYFGMGSLFTGGWSHIPNALTLTYSWRDFAIGGWSKQDGSWHPNNLFINSHTGFVGINTDGPQFNLDVNGSLRASQIVGPPNANLIIAGQDVGIPGVGYGVEIHAVKNGINFQTYNGGWGSRMYIKESGKVGIGTTDMPGDHILYINGSAIATQVVVKLKTAWPDYAFESTYNLCPLSQVESFIKENKHLPEIPSAAEVKANGINLGEMDALLLKKIEELTLYMIEMKKENEEIKVKNDLLEKEIELLKTK